MTADGDGRVGFALIPLSVVPARAIQSPQWEQSEGVGSVLGCVAQLPKALPPAGWTVRQPSSALRDSEATSKLMNWPQGHLSLEQRGAGRLHEASACDFSSPVSTRKL